MRDDHREATRQEALAAIALLDTPPEREFDALARLAQRMLGTSMSSVTLVDSDRQWAKARCGPLALQTSRQGAICPLVVETGEPLAVGDASLDPRFAGSPLVLGKPFIRYYAGVPVHARRGDGDPVAIGTLCVLDETPRETGAADLELLSELACVAEALMEARSLAVTAARTAEDHRLLVERLERDRRQSKQAERMAEMGSWRYDIATNMTSWSDGVFAIHELPVSGGVPNGAVMEFFPEPDRAAFLEAVMRTLDTGEPFELDADFRTARGRPRRVRVLCEIELAKGTPVALIGLIQDITERHGLEERLREQARTDDLTQLPNRAEFHRVLDASLRVAEAEHRELAVLLIDLDGFKGVNDAFGHAAGDEVLRRVADRLRGLRLDGCVPARLGGDEFAVVVPSRIARADLAPIVTRLLADLAIETGVGEEVARVTGTVGIAWSGDGAGERDRLLRRADAALYKAKRNRKGTAYTYRPAALDPLAGLGHRAACRPG